MDNFSFRLKPGSMAVGIGRKTLAAMQFLKTFSLDHMESTRLADQAEILELKPGERIDIDGYFRGIIYSGLRMNYSKNIYFIF